MKYIDSRWLVYLAISRCAGRYQIPNDDSVGRDKVGQGANLTGYSGCSVNHCETHCEGHCEVDG